MSTLKTRISGAWSRAGSPSVLEQVGNGIVVVPEDFGAVGDGTTNDTAALQEWLDEPGVLHWLPDNVYAATSLDVPAYCHVDGVGTIRQRAGTVPSSDYGLLQATGGSGSELEGIVIRNITIDGNRANMGGSFNSNQETLDFTYVVGALVDHVTVLSSIADSIDLDNSWHCQIVNCRILDAGKAGVHLSGGAYENFVGMNHVEGAGARDTTRAAFTQVNSGAVGNIFVGNRAKDSNKGYEIENSGAIGVGNVSDNNSSADTLTGASSWA